MFLLIFLTYLAERLISDPLSVLWVVIITKWVAKYPAHLLWDLYDTYLLSYVPPLVSEHIRSLNLSFVLS